MGDQDIVEVEEIDTKEVKDKKKGKYVIILLVGIAIGYGVAQIQTQAVIDQAIDYYIESNQQLFEDKAVEQIEKEVESQEKDSK